MDVADAAEQIAPILREVREEGAEAVLRWSERLDGVRPPALRVPTEQIANAEAGLEPAVR
ncbi:MAG: histidinol dehydrogenase, partial [Actinobacteria bacterium]|nr:histidinol dehydrogenase [Actinomycetota bacterium]